MCRRNRKAGIYDKADESMKPVLKAVAYLFLAFTVCLHGRAAHRLNDLVWEVSYTAGKQLAISDYIPATVPGAVQLDIARALDYPPYEWNDNYKQYGWMEDVYYTYRTYFKKPRLDTGEKLYFVSKGIDYRFEIYLNGSQIHTQEGMFTWVDLDLTGKLTENNCLQILVYPVPKSYPGPSGRSQASHVVKPAASYGWDWHPRLVPLGIWDDTYLEKRASSFVKDVWVRYRLSDDFSKAAVTLQIEGENITNVRYRWQLKDDRGKTVLETNANIPESGCSDTLILRSPDLWWTHDLGTPYLYTSVFELKDRNGNTVQTITGNVGFRRIRLVMNEGAWDEPADYPKSRSVPPAQFELNGYRLFAKGTNWVNPEIYPGTIGEKRYRELIGLATEAHFNTIRIWGGGIINKESFFDLCDREGILVWEEFPLACNSYPDDEHYLKILAQEATSIIKRVRKHPCLALWCGGNELFNSWSSMTDQSLPLRLLNSLCLTYDPDVPYNPTSPISGMAHGNYLFRYFDGREIFQALQESRSTAYTEFGIPGMSPLEVLKNIIPAQDLFPPRPGTAWETHHAFNTWIPTTWLCPDILEFYFGKAGSLVELIEQSQLLQSEGYKALYEEARRQKPYCAMALNWCFDEPWPAAVNNSLIAYPAVPKPAYYAVKNSCRPVCASARLSKFVWSAGETFFTEIWLLNDSFTPSEPLTVRVKLQAGNRTIELLDWTTPALSENKNIQGPTVRFDLPEWPVTRFKVWLEVDEKPEYNSEYTLLYRTKTKNN